jgi:cell division septal protein FtsQ
MARKTESKSKKHTGSNKSSKSNKTKNVSSKGKQKLLRIFLVLLIIGAAVTAVGFGCWGLYQVLFSKNERFTLRRLELQGLDPDRTRSLAHYLDLKMNEDNLFDIDIASLKRKITNISYISDVSVYRVLPDTLKVNVIQRIPLAYLSKFGSKWVIDEDCIVMNRKYCMKVRYTLPVINNFKYKSFNSGERLPQLEEAVELIKLATYEFRNFKIYSLDLKDADKITFVMIRNRRRAYKVIMPRKNLKRMMIILREALANKQGKYKSTIDLTYREQAVFR